MGRGAQSRALRGRNRVASNVDCPLVPAIEVVNLQRAFSAEVLAVAGIDLEVAEGEIYSFLGPNGAGKTTTVRMLTTLLRPTGGSARVAGHDVVAEPAAVRGAIGVLPSALGAVRDALGAVK